MIINALQSRIGGNAGVGAGVGLIVGDVVITSQTVHLLNVISLSSSGSRNFVATDVFNVVLPRFHNSVANVV